jgi:hypothetical protein
MESCVWAFYLSTEVDMITIFKDWQGRFRTREGKIEAPLHSSYNL